MKSGLKARTTPTVTLMLMVFAFSLAACSTVPRQGWRYEYVPVSTETKVHPSDPFNLTDSQYADSSQVIVARVKAEALVKEANAPDADEELRYTLAIKSLSELVSRNHAPSLHLAGLLLTEGSLGSRGLTTSPASLTSESPDEMRAKGVEFLVLAARMGYPESIALLKKLKRRVPKRDMTPPPVQIIQYELRKVDAAPAPPPSPSDDSDEEILDAVGGVLEGILKTAVIAAAVVAAAYGQAQAQALKQDQSDLSGCCSWHGGIDRDVFGNRRCDFLARVVCNDGTPSVSCRCY